MTRREAREIIIGLLFECEFQEDQQPEETYARAMEAREFEDVPFVHDTFFGVLAHMQDVDEKIGEYSKGWKVGNISSVTRAVLRLGTYELLFSTDVPSKVAINEALELVRKYDDEKNVPFTNGILNSIKNEIETHE